MRRLLSDIPENDLTVRYLLPDPALRRYFSGYHVYDAGPVGSPPRQEWFFPGWANVRFQHVSGPWQIGYGNAPPSPVPPVALFGPSRSGAHSITRGGQLFGFGVTPIGWYRLFAAPAHRFVDRITPIGDLWPAGHDLHARLADARTTDDVRRTFDAFLLARLRPAHPDEALVANLFDLMIADHDVDLGVAAGRLGCSPIKLRRIARCHFGYAPKILLRRSRFLKSLIAIYGREAGEWSRLIDPGYFDQSHFIRDAQDFLGMTPGAFLALDRPMTLLSIRARMQVLGAPMQALHRLAAPLHR